MSLRAVLIRGALPIAAAAATKIASGRGHGGGGGPGGAVATGAIPPEPNRKGAFIKSALKVGLALLELRSAAKKR